MAEGGCGRNVQADAGGAAGQGKQQGTAEPWEQIAWSEERQHILYRDWGDFFTQKQKLDIALECYDRALELTADDPKALLFRSKCQRQRSYVEKALNDSVKAAGLDTFNPHIDAETCKNLYELNQFENSLAANHNNTRKYVHAYIQEFLNNIVVIEENMKDSVGESLTPFIKKYGKLFQEVLDYIARKEHIETRPLWKVMHDEGKCDVLSIPDLKEELLSPREKARRRQAHRVFSQIYLGRSWKDLELLKELGKNPDLMLKSSKESVPVLYDLIETKCAAVETFMKMLHSRSPLYNERIAKFGDESRMKAYREKHLNRVQYATRWTMNSVLRKIRKLRSERKIEELARYIEQVMGDYVVLKTSRVMCWKFEFMNEVYNTLALAFTDSYLSREQLVRDHHSNILKLLHLPTDRHKPVIPFVFGDKSTYQEPDAIDEKFEAYKRFLTRLEKRMLFAKHYIESTYLYHEVARAHLKNNRFDECCSVARKGIEAAKLCNSNIYAFLNCLLIVKAHASLHKVERCYEALNEAHEFVIALRSKGLESFVEACQAANEYDIITKKKMQSSLPKIRLRASRISVASAYSSRRASLTDEEEEEDSMENEVN